MIGKLEQDKKAHWSEHLPEMLSAYNGTCSVVTVYSPYFLLFGRKARMPVDYLFPTLCDSPHQTKMEVSVAAMQKRLKEAFAVARHLTSQEAAKQQCYYDCKAGAVALQPGDVVMVHTDGFVGKRKVKAQWEDRGFIVGTCSVVTVYSPYFLLFGRKARMPVDYLFPTLPWGCCYGSH